MQTRRAVRILAAVGVGAAALMLVYQAYAHHGELPNRIPEAAPYHVGEAQFYPPPFHDEWTGVNDPGSCSGCHITIFDQWNGSMMSNAWRDPGWRGAFLLVARLTATDGNCGAPDPPDGTARADVNPFADPGGGCTSTWDLGTSSTTTSDSGSLLDDFCSRCHMPADYIDNIPLTNVAIDPVNGLEHGLVDPGFNPTSDNGTGLAFATLEAQYRNTEPGKWGIFCEVCHTTAESRHTPYHNYEISGTQYVPALGTDPRDQLVPLADQDKLDVADPASASLGYTVGAGSYRLSPHAIVTPERFGPLTWNDYSAMLDPYVSDVFDINFFYQLGEFSGKHDGFYNVLFERAEMCAGCHDVTNPLTIKNQLGNWVGGFPIERTYTEWRTSRYADRPGNTNFDPAFKRDCLTCHMQQSFEQPGTALTLYDELGNPAPPASDKPCKSGPVRPVFYTHHFVGGNAYVTRLLGADITSNGSSEPYPELSVFSHTSADKTSRYSRAVYENVTATGAATHHARMAWERLQHALDFNLTAPATADAGTTVPLVIDVTNSGTGHNFPSGFPEGRNAWIAVRAFDLATDVELEIHDSFWNRTSLGVGYLTGVEMDDPNFPGCGFKLPPGSADPYARQFKAIASLGDGCPTLDLPYAAPLNLVTDGNGLPIDAAGLPIDRSNPLGLPQFTDLDGDGDVFDDSFLVDWRLRPLPHPGATEMLDRYSVVVPPGTQGPIVVSAAVYYQSFEAVVGEKFLGNLADTDEDFLLEPCILKGACDGRVPVVEPAVVEGSAPVLMEMRNAVIAVNGTPADTAPPALFGTYPADGAVDTFLDVVPKVFFNEPVANFDDSFFTMADSNGLTVPGFSRQVGDGAWAFFPAPIYLEGREDYTMTIAAGVCDQAGNCTTSPITWTFTTARDAADGTGNTSVPIGFGVPEPTPFPTVSAIDPPDGESNVPVTAVVTATFSESVLGVDVTTFRLNEAADKNCAALGAAVAGSVGGNGNVWTFTPSVSLMAGRTEYCVTLDAVITSELTGQPLNGGTDFVSSFKTER